MVTLEKAHVVNWCQGTYFFTHVLMADFTSQTQNNLCQPKQLKFTHFQSVKRHKTAALCGVYLTLFVCPF